MFKKFIHQRLSESLFAVAISLLLLLLSAPAQAEPQQSVEFQKVWSQYFFSWRGPWRQEMATPSISKDGRIFIHTQSGRAHALDRKNGKKIWKNKIGQPALGKPGLGQEAVIFPDREGHIHAFTPDYGKKLWSRQFESQIYSEPVLHNGMVYLLTQNYQVTALDERTGKTLWEHGSVPPLQLTLQLPNRVLLAENTLYASMGEAQVAALEPFTGRTLWKRTFAQTRNTFGGVSTPAWTAKGVAVPLVGQGVFFLDTQRGNIQWKYPMSEVVQVLFHEANPEEFIALGIHGNVQAIDIQTGKKSWEIQIPTKPKVSRTPLVACGNFLIMGDSHGNLYAIHPDHGKILWQDELFFSKGSISGIANDPLSDSCSFAAWTENGTLIYFRSK